MIMWQGLFLNEIILYWGMQNIIYVHTRVGDRKENETSLS